MKKNILTKTFAVLASTAILGATSMLSANAAGATVSVSSAEATPGQTVTLSVMVDSANLDSVDALVSYDAALNGTAATLAAGVSGDSATDGSNTSIAVFSGSALPNGEIATIDFTVPEDAEVGSTYTIGLSLNTVGQADPAEDITDSSTAVAGTITVIDIPTEPSTPEETTVPTEETTVAETVAETTAAETKAETTAAAATTTAAPKTGAAGVAVAVAGLVTAGTAAVVIKKKH